MLPRGRGRGLRALVALSPTRPPPTSEILAQKCHEAHAPPRVPSVCTASRLSHAADRVETRTGIWNPKPLFPTKSKVQSEELSLRLGPSLAISMPAGKRLETAREKAFVRGRFREQHSRRTPEAFRQGSPPSAPHLLTPSLRRGSRALRGWPGFGATVSSRGTAQPARQRRWLGMTANPWAGRSCLSFCDERGP